MRYAHYRALHPISDDMHEESVHEAARAERDMTIFGMLLGKGIAIMCEHNPRRVRCFGFEGDEVNEATAEKV